ncbi:hypothetical protein DFH28DRAFT_1012134, partial [Melampsora americana]
FHKTTATSPIIYLTKKLHIINYTLSLVFTFESVILIFQALARHIQICSGQRASNHQSITRNCLNLSAFLCFCSYSSCVSLGLFCYQWQIDVVRYLYVLSFLT